MWVDDLRRPTLPRLTIRSERNRPSTDGPALRRDLDTERAADLTEDRIAIPDEVLESNAPNTARMFATQIDCEVGISIPALGILEEIAWVP